ncbi:Cysteine-rich secretory protein-related protein [Dioscorea alata]|uniref:Cysteine-rich secretory protein-related protein n=1 Tax=Dioscorea alata TaxID=55571 RepID=A0ACB7UVU4_DIOAL|nr:Cysteine-rich secretory protein-related protein [Dioscorea alata]
MSSLDQQHLFLGWNWNWNWILLVPAIMMTMTSLAGARHVLLSSAPIPSAQPNPNPNTTATNTTEQFLTVHNKARAAVNVAPLSWSLKLYSDASLFVRYQRDKKGCDFADLGSSPYGANQAWASYPARPLEVVGSWVDEKQYYNHAKNTCEAGHECGTYTQVVWRKTTQVGCAQATCTKERATLTICLYFPHGNVQGQSPY